MRHVTLECMIAAEEYSLPSLDEQLDLLRTTGNQFDPDERRERRLPIPGIMLEGEDGELEQALYDAGVVPTIPSMIVPSNGLCRALQELRPNRLTSRYMGGFMTGLFFRADLIVGFSGYGTGTEPGGKRYDYETEYQGMVELFDVFHEAEVPVSHVVDGGTGYGVPGLSGIIAEQQGLKTIGYAPARSLRGIARRDTSVIVGKEFGDEAVALGSTPDMLVALGGGPNAEKEVEAALAVGSRVMLLNLRDYPGSSIAYMADRHEGAKEAKAKEQLVVCTSMDEAREVIKDLDLPEIKKNRYPDRYSVVRRALARTL